MQAVAAAADAEERQDKGERDELTSSMGRLLHGRVVGKKNVQKEERGRAVFYRRHVRLSSGCPKLYISADESQLQKTDLVQATW
jgi:hypothetical protein